MINLTSPLAYEDRDDARHFYDKEDYYEWWYFDAQLENGYKCVVNFDHPAQFVVNHPSTVQIDIYTPEGEKYSELKEFDKGKCSASEDHCDVRMGANFVRQENDVYKMSVHIKGGFLQSERDIGADLAFKNKLPSWKPQGTGLLYAGKDGHIHGWIVAMPKADVEGTLYFDGKSLPVRGNRGYHDHNWGTTNSYNHFSRWYWARLHDPKYTLIYGYVYPAKEADKIVSLLYLAKDGTPVLTTNRFELKEKKKETDRESGKSFATNLLINCRKKDVQVKCSVSTKNVVEIAQLPTNTNWPQYYFRFLAQYKAEIKMHGLVDNICGETIHEHVILR